MFLNILFISKAIPFYKFPIDAYKFNFPIMYKVKLAFVLGNLVPLYQSDSKLLNLQHYILQHWSWSVRVLFKSAYLNDFVGQTLFNNFIKFQKQIILHYDKRTTLLKLVYLPLNKLIYILLNLIWFYLSKILNSYKN